MSGSVNLKNELRWQCKGIDTWKAHLIRQNIGYKKRPIRHWILSHARTKLNKVKSNVRLSTRNKKTLLSTKSIKLIITKSIRQKLTWPYESSNNRTLPSWRKCDQRPRKIIIKKIMKLFSSAKSKRQSWLTRESMRPTSIRGVENVISIAPLKRKRHVSIR